VVVELQSEQVWNGLKKKKINFVLLAKGSGLVWQLLPQLLWLSSAIKQSLILVFE